MKRKYTGLTMVELITVVAIIALLMALLIPSVAAVRRLAKETQQKAQLSSIEMALEAFKIDQGYYPPSDVNMSATTNIYGGAQKLADALFGRDLVGFYPNMTWDTPDNIRQEYIDNSYPSQRSDLYLSKGIPYVFRCEQLFTGNELDPLSNVICDVFGRWTVTRADGKVVKAGIPILYYRAEPITSGGIRDIYKRSDNDILVETVLAKLQLSSQIISTNPLAYSSNMVTFYGDRTEFNPSGVYGYIQNPDITTRVWPYNPDSFLLISAGQDGIYGNADDITNFR